MTIKEIYIPLWLDLLYLLLFNADKMRQDLHSTMVRFIIKEYNSHTHPHPQFTFHYG